MIVERSANLTAGAVIDAYKALGGTIIVEGDLVWFGLPFPDCSEQADDFRLGIHEGRVSALTELVRCVPGLRTAVIEHIRAWPSAKYGSTLLA